MEICNYKTAKFRLDFQVTFFISYAHERHRGKKWRSHRGKFTSERSTWIHRWKIQTRRAGNSERDTCVAGLYVYLQETMYECFWGRRWMGDLSLYVGFPREFIMVEHVEGYTIVIMATWTMCLGIPISTLVKKDYRKMDITTLASLSAIACIDWATSQNRKT